MALLKSDISREERQFIYAWFNAMLARELSGEQLNAYKRANLTIFLHTSANWVLPSRLQNFKQN